MRNSSVYPKSTPEEARLPCIGSRAILNSPPNTTSGLIFFRQLQRFPENTVPSLEEHQIQQRNTRNLHVVEIVSRRELIPWLPLKRYANFPQAAQQEPSLSNRYVRDPEFAVSSGVDPEMP